MKNADKTLVAQIALEFNTYYVTDRFGITLDGQDYENAVISWGIAEYKGNFGEVFEVGSFEIRLTQGERFTDNGYLFDPTDIWNNKTVTVKRWSSGDSSFSSDCKVFLKGQIKNFENEGTSISFTIDISNTKDDKLLPSILIEDQSGLSESEYKTNVIGALSQQLSITDPTIFSEDELVVLKNNDGDVEYIQLGTPINPVSGFNTKHQASNNYNLVNGGTAEKAFVNVPKNSVGKTVPIQIGDLTDTSNGIFGKAVTINEKIGNQAIVVDGLEQHTFTNVGVWEKGTRRYFTAIADKSVESALSQDANSGQADVYVVNPAVFFIDTALTVEDDLNSEVVQMATIDSDTSSTTYGKITLAANLSNSYTTANNAKLSQKIGEYDSVGNAAIFLTDPKARIKTGTLLNSTDDISIVKLEPGHAKYIDWYTEDSKVAQVNTEIMSPTILAIGTELVQILEAPDTTNDIIYVERGYGNTTKTQHNGGDAIYQGSKFLSRNMFLFRERFDPKAAANMYYGSESLDYDLNQTVPGKYTSRSYTNPSQYITSAISNQFDDDGSTYFEFRQLNSDNDYYCLSWLSYDLKFQVVEDDFIVLAAHSGIKLDASTSSTFNYTLDGQANVGLLLVKLDEDSYDTAFTDLTQYAGLYGDLCTSAQALNSINCYDSFETDANSGSWELVGLLHDSGQYVINKLTDLNRRWKILLACTQLRDTGGSSQSVGFNIKVYNIGFWIDFLADFTQNPIGSKTKGRKITADVNTITGGTTGNLCENPVDVLALLLTQELGYETTDFTSDWSTVKTYFDTSGNFSEGDTPLVAASYGVDDKRKKGWALCSEIAAHYNIAITKEYDCKIGIVNLHEIYFNTPSGNEIAIEDILFLPQTSQRRITIYQTGVSEIYNDFVIKWKRNNSTNEYQGAYKLPDTTNFEHSANSLAGARANYYGNQKRNMTIESPFIYNENDALRKAKWEANDKAEAHFWIEFFIDGEHYSEMQSPPLTEQYEVGDIIYLTGKHGGMNFQSTNKFYIQNIRFHDAGRVVEINAKSLQPVTAFETTATTGADIIQDTGGDSWSGDTIQDSGGDAFAGDTIQDTGG